MSNALERARARTPDDHCCSCGRGVFETAFSLDDRDLTHQSCLTDCEAFTVCGDCLQLEIMLVQQSGTKDHPMRLTHYERMRERVHA